MQKDQTNTNLRDVWLSTNAPLYEPHLSKAIAYHLQELIKFSEDKLKNLERQYLELIKSGRPFAERRELGLELTYTSRSIQEFKHARQNFTPLPMTTWIDEADIKLIETVGFLAAVGNPLTLFRTYTLL